MSQHYKKTLSSLRLLCSTGKIEFYSPMGESKITRKVWFCGSVRPDAGDDGEGR